MNQSLTQWQRDLLQFFSKSQSWPALTKWAQAQDLPYSTTVLPWVQAQIKAGVLVTERGEDKLVRIRRVDLNKQPVAEPTPVDVDVDDETDEVEPAAPPPAATKAQPKVDPNHQTLDVLILEFLKKHSPAKPGQIYDYTRRNRNLIAAVLRELNRKGLVHEVPGEGWALCAQTEVEDDELKPSVAPPARVAVCSGKAFQQKILATLQKESLTVKEIRERVSGGRAQTQNHLKIMSDAGVIVRKPGETGSFVYSLPDSSARVPDPVQADGMSRIDLVVDMVRRLGRATKSVVAKRLEMENHVALKALREAVQAGRLCRKGTGNMQYYVLSAQEAKRAPVPTAESQSASSAEEAFDFPIEREPEPVSPVETQHVPDATIPSNPPAQSETTPVATPELRAPVPIIQAYETITAWLPSGTVVRGSVASIVQFLLLWSAPQKATP